MVSPSADGEFWSTLSAGEQLRAGSRDALAVAWVDVTTLKSHSGQLVSEASEVHLLVLEVSEAVVSAADSIVEASEAADSVAEVVVDTAADEAESAMEARMAIQTAHHKAPAAATAVHASTIMDHVGMQISNRYHQDQGTTTATATATNQALAVGEDRRGRMKTEVGTVEIAAGDGIRTPTSPIGGGMIVTILVMRINSSVRTLR
jgi:hypothetical protein